MLPCQRAADVDGNGQLQITDAVLIYDYLFLGGTPVPSLGIGCTSDPGGSSSLSCEAKDACQEPTPPPPGPFTFFVSTEPDAEEPPQSGLGLFGSPGQVFEVPFFVQLKGGVPAERPPISASSWSLGIRPESDKIDAVVVGATVEGTESLNYFSGGFRTAAPSSESGAMSATTLSFIEIRTLPMQATSVLQGTLRVTGPALGAEGVVMLRVVDGLMGPGASPVSLEVVSIPQGPFRPESVPLKVFVASPIGLGAFIRGDVNGDDAHDISDPVSTLGTLFLGAPPPACPDAADSNDDGKVDISDAVFSLGCLFLGERCPAAPFPSCGTDPTDDQLKCEGLRFDCI